MEINKLMVVAHPDDETMFGGDELIQEEGWKVICITDGDNPVRSKEFTRAMEAFNAEYEIWSYKDAWTEHVNRPSLEQDLLRALGERSYKKIVTHNLQGEYGHPEHKAVSEVMHNLVKEHLYVFDITVDEVLEMHILRKKLEISEIYKSQLHAFEQLSKYWIKARSTKVK